MSGLDLEGLARKVDQHGQITRILILSTKGSAPREAGTAMLVSKSGQSGTIGGGALEFQAVETARAMTAQQSRQKIPLGPDLGQCCGGSVELLFEHFDAQTLPKAAQGFARPISSTAPSEPPFPVRHAQTQARQGTPTGIVFAQDWLWEPINPTRTPLWLYGAGHVGRSVVQTLQGLPFEISWIDTDAARYPETFPEHVAQVIAKNPAELVPYAPDTALHVVMTFSHALDLEICAAVLVRPHGWLGLIGSATKAARFRKRLAEMNRDPAGLTCPIGDPTLGKEPAAIAIGLARDLLRLQNISQGVREQGNRA